MFRDALLDLSKKMADCRILKANYNAKLQKYFLVSVDRTTKVQKTWAIPAADVWPSQAAEEDSEKSGQDSENPTSELKEAEPIHSGG